MAIIVIYHYQEFHSERRVIKISTINATVIEQTLTITNSPLIATGGIIENYIEFNFDSTWDGFTKVAVFYQDKDHVYRQIIDPATNKCVIPHEATTSIGAMFFGVYGASGDIVLTTEVIRYRVVEGAITEDTEPSDPTPDIYLQMLQIYNSLVTNYNNLTETLNTNFGEKTEISTSRNIGTFWQSMEYVNKYLDTDLTNLLNQALANSSTQGVINLINDSVMPNLLIESVKFTENGTFTVPKGIKKIIVTAAAGGGGGGGGSTLASSSSTTGAKSGSGGGGGDYCVNKVINVTPGEIINIVIGKGGKGGTGHAAGSEGIGGTGETGGATVIGKYLTLVGGSGGGVPYQVYDNDKKIYSYYPCIGVGSGSGGDGGMGGDYNGYVNAGTSSDDYYGKSSEPKNKFVNSSKGGEPGEYAYSSYGSITPAGGGGASYGKGGNGGDYNSSKEAGTVGNNGNNGELGSGGGGGAGSCVATNISSVSKGGDGGDGGDGFCYIAYGMNIIAEI